MTISLTASALALAFSAALGAPAQTVSTPVASVLPPVYTVRDQVQEYFADLPIMVAIAGCESHYRQFDAVGNVFRGEINNLDVGVMQINERYHLQTATKLNIDLDTIEGNMNYARLLYEREGTTPWASSKGCWGKFEKNLAQK